MYLKRTQPDNHLRFRITGRDKRAVAHAHSVRLVKVHMAFHPKPDDDDSDADDLPVSEQLADVFILTEEEHERCVDSTVTHRRL